MTIAALGASGTSSPDGLAYDAKSKVDELVTNSNADDVLLGATAGRVKTASTAPTNL